MPTVSRKLFIYTLNLYCVASKITIRKLSDYDVWLWLAFGLNIRVFHLGSL